MAIDKFLNSQFIIGPRFVAVVCCSWKYVNVVRISNSIRFVTYNKSYIANCFGIHLVVFWRREFDLWTAATAAKLSFPSSASTDPCPSPLREFFATALSALDLSSASIRKARCTSRPQGRTRRRASLSFGRWCIQSRTDRSRDSSV